MENKRAKARALSAHFGIKWQIRLDDLDGTIHHSYGQVPYMTWITGPSAQSRAAIYAGPDAIPGVPGNFLQAGGGLSPA